MIPIVIISGPPGAGKSVLADALTVHFERSIRIPVDDLRHWVLSGLSEPDAEWPPETDLQFRLAEDSAADIAKRYHEAGFVVIIDHCRAPSNLADFQSRCFGPGSSVKVALAPNLEENRRRNFARTNKDFDPAELDPTILGLNPLFQEVDTEEWIKIANERAIEIEAEELANRLLTWGQAGAAERS